MTSLVPQRLGPYELLESLATGGMAEVYLARRSGPHGFQKFFAVKRILPQLAQDTDFVGMFVDEARLSAQLSHPNIVHVFDFGEDQGELYMALEYVHGTTCAKLLRFARKAAGGLTLPIALHIGMSVLRALEYAHGANDEHGESLQLVHRDVSPGNVLLHESGAVKLADFGIARAAPIERRTDVGQLKGKLGYMSPEQVTASPLDHRSDLFTLAIVLTELCTQAPLFAGPNELEVLTRIGDADLRALDAVDDRALPTDLRAVLCRAMAKDPAARFASARAFLDALDVVVSAHQLYPEPEALSNLLRALDLVPEYPAERALRTQGPLSTPRAQISTLPEAQEVASEALSERWHLQQGHELLGPLSYPALVELFATGKVQPGTLVSHNDGELLPPHRFPELSRFMTSPALKWSTRMPDGMIDRGPLRRAVLPSRLFYLASRRETGALVLQEGERRKRLYFVRGVPEYIASTEKSELLGEVLIRKERLLRMELDMAVAMLPKFGGKLGDALVGLGVLRPAELFHAIHAQLEERFVELFSWQSGEIGFLPGERSQEETLPFNVDTYPLIARGIREHYMYPELQAMLAHTVVRPVQPLPVRVQSFRLEPLEERLLLMIDGPTTLAALEQRCARIAPAVMVLRVVLFGLSCELLCADGWEPFTSTRAR